MPRLTSKQPAYRLHKRSGQAVVTLGGRDHYLGPHGTPASRAEYDRLIADWLKGGRRVSGPAAPDLTVQELILAYWRHAEVDYRRPEGSTAPELENLRLALRPLRLGFGPTPASAFGPLKLAGYRQRLLDSGLCRVTINQRVNRVIRAFAWAESQELLPAGHHHALKTLTPLRKGRSKAKESRAVRPVPDADVQATLPFLCPQLRAVVELQRLTGMRSGEVLPITTGAIDRGGPVWVYRPARHKAAHHGKERVIYLGPRAQAVLTPWLRADPDAPLFQPREAERERHAARRLARRTPLTPSQKARQKSKSPKKAPGDSFDSRAYAHAVRHACRRAGVEHWHPHQLRHNAATELRRDFGLETARVVLGHSSPVVTEIYAEADRQKALKAMEQVG